MIQNVLVPLDGSHLAETAIPHALAVATSFDARVLLARVVERSNGHSPVVDSMDWRLSQAEAHAYLEALRERISDDRVRTIVADGKAAEQIVRLVADHRADLVVMSSHGCGGPSEFKLSGTVHKVVSRAATSILVVPAGQCPQVPETDIRYRRILVPLDCSARGDWGLHFAAMLARAHGAVLFLSHFVPMPQVPQRFSRTDITDLANRLVASSLQTAEQYLGEEAARLSSPDLTIEVVVRSSTHVAGSIAELVREKEIDLVVAGAHGVTGTSDPPYGSIAAALLSGCNRPILVLQDLPQGAPKQEVRAATRLANAQLATPLRVRS